MIYQKLHLGDPPYLIGWRENKDYPVHKHYEIELFFCLKGKYDLLIGNEKYILNKGELAVIGSMIPHGLPETNLKYDSACRVIEVGPAMLGKFFAQLEKEPFSDPVFNLNLPEHKHIIQLINELGELSNNSSPFSFLAQTGNVYKICAYVFENFIKSNTNANTAKKVTTIMNIENCLDYIYTNYDKKITVEDAAALCGYSTSNFCKIFKSITNDTFHNVLNTHRIKVACALLEDSTLSMEEISAKVGFSDVKSFYRVFKEKKGATPSVYRKGIKTEQPG